MIFADDTQIYLQCLLSELDNDLCLVNHNIHVIANYAAASGLSLNLKKSKIMILGSNVYVRNLDFALLPAMTINHTMIPFVHEARNLGLYFSLNLLWSKHVFHLTKSPGHAT